MALAPERQWAVVLVLGSSQTLSWGSTFYLPAILTRPIAADLGVSDATVFGAFSLALLIWAGLGPVIGKRIDQFGGRGVLAGSNLVFALGLVLLGLSQNLFMLFAAWTLLGVGMSAGLYEAAFAALAAIYGDKARTPITGITLVAGFASTICWPISAGMDAELGWRMACFIWAISHLVIGLPLNWFLLPKGVHWARPDNAESMVDGAPVRFDRTMLLLAIFFAVTAYIGIAMGSHLPGLMLAAGATPAAAIVAAGLMGPAQVSARILEFGLLRRFNPLVSAMFAAASHPVAAAVLLAFGGAAIYPFALIHGAGNGLLTIARGTLPLALFGAAGYGFRQGVLTAPARVLQAAAPITFSYVIDELGLLSLLVSSGLGLIGLCCLLLLRRQPK